jgi:hypothetical protein
MSTTNQIATAICQVLGMPSRFAAEKPPVSPTLRGSLTSYMRGLSDEALAGCTTHGGQLACEVAALEVVRRQRNPDTHCLDCGEVLSIYSHCWRCHWPPMDPKQDAITQTTTVAAKPHHIPCGQCGACYANEQCARLL